MRWSEVERVNWHVHVSATGPLTRVLFETFTTAKPQVSSRVIFVGKVSEGGRDRVAVAHQHKIGNLVPYLEIQ